ncbi:PIN domain-containing protein [Sphingomonas xinjiangensis]|uniref:Ribonuclease VapC n=1 Tax=Sphingomonas xinjiangensis TaxID=643568 RepID=A0A840YNV8_9SPHN|nr:tRNA(fMet)-specific endonuclease VapC [Sphingomonas xinjiangensis]
MTEPVFMLDSNILIYVLKSAFPNLRRRIEAADVGMVATSSIAYAEVMLGAQASGAAEQAERVFQVVSVLPFDQVAARAYAGLPFRRGRFDRLIAAHALSLGLTLVTNNDGDFAAVPGLKIENWTK